MAKRLLTPSNLKSVRFEVSGLEEYLKRVQETGKDIDQAVAKAIEESAKPIHADIETWAEKHKRTGVTLEGVDTSEVQSDGNFIYVEVGINEDKSKGAWHAVFVEYGTPTQPADPGVRPAFDVNKSKVKKIQRDVLRQEGMPVE